MRFLTASLLLVPLASAAAPLFPLRASANQRYLEDQNGVPFPILGRTAWFVISLSAADQATFLENTAAKGYDAIEFHVLDHDPRGNNPPFANAGALLPFRNRIDGAAWSGSLTYANINTEAPDFTSLNEPYWVFVDQFLSACEAKGIVVLMFPAYVGYSAGDQGWMQEMTANGGPRMTTYGNLLATRYKNRKNIVWMMGGDMGGFTAPQQAAESGLIDGLKGVAGQESTHFAAEWNSESICTDQVPFGSNCTLNSTYSWAGNVSTFTRGAYASTPTRPAFLLEDPYDEEGPDGNAVNPSATQPVRRFQWWGVLSGIAGYVSGNGLVWPFNAGWKTHLDTQGAQDMARLNAFVATIPWWTLVPSGLGGMKTLITAGGSNPASASYVAAAAASDGTLLVAYLPPAHSSTVTVDMTAMTAPARARWFNPASGAFSDISTALPNTGTRVFTPPGNNGTGFADWVLVLDTGSLQPCDGGSCGPAPDGGAQTDAGQTTIVEAPRAGCGCVHGTMDGSLLGAVLAAGLWRRRGRN